jgi:hypothetical protein
VSHAYEIVSVAICLVALWRGASAATPQLPHRPGRRPAKLEKAAGLDVDEVILDLEGAVARTQDGAETLARALLTTSGAPGRWRFV